MVWALFGCKGVVSHCLVQPESCLVCRQPAWCLLTHRQSLVLQPVSLLMSLGLVAEEARRAALLHGLQLTAREAALSQAETALKQQSEHMEAAAQLTQREAEVSQDRGCRPSWAVSGSCCRRLGATTPFV